MTDTVIVTSDNTPPPENQPAPATVETLAVMLGEMKARLESLPPPVVELAPVASMCEAIMNGLVEVKAMLAEVLAELQSETDDEPDDTAEPAAAPEGGAKVTATEVTVDLPPEPEPKPVKTENTSSGFNLRRFLTS